MSRNNYTRGVPDYYKRALEEIKRLHKIISHYRAIQALQNESDMFVHYHSETGEYEVYGGFGKDKDAKL